MAEIGELLSEAQHKLSTYQSLITAQKAGTLEEAS